MQSLQMLLDLHERTQQQVRTHVRFFEQTLKWSQKNLKRDDELSPLLNTTKKEVKDFPKAHMVSARSERILNHLLMTDLTDTLRHPDYATAKAMLELEALKKPSAIRTQNTNRSQLYTVIKAGLNKLTSDEIEQKETDKAKASKKMKRK